MRYWYVIFAVFTGWKSFAQEAKSDSIPAVEIIAYRERAYLGTSNTFSPDSLQQQLYGRSNLGDLLQRTSPVLINHYGSGNASVSIRGTGDDHTLVLWNGLPLNSSTLGSMDISLLSDVAAPRLQVITNAGSNLFGSGAFGGVILLEEDTHWRNELNLGARTDIGSFDAYRADLTAAAGNDKLQFRSGSFFQDARNAFPYTDIFKAGQPRLYLDHNGLRQGGTVNTLRGRIGLRHILQAGNWYQYKEKAIPGIMGAYQPSSKWQSDRSSRSFLKYNRLMPAGQLQATAAHFYDELQYTDKLNPTDTFLFINSDFRTQRWLNSLSYRRFFGSLQFDAAADLNTVIADVSAYGQRVRELQGALFSGVQYTAARFLLSATVRQEFRPGGYIRPMFGATAEFRTRQQRYAVGVSYADKFHAPDLNDRYWTPGGNPDLLPELGFTTELNQRFRLLAAARNSLNLRLNAYYSVIRNEIVWMPVSALVWSPENLRNARHYGLEFFLDYDVQVRSGILSLDLLYLYNRSEILEYPEDPFLEGHSLAYRPGHILKANAGYRNAYFCGGASYVFTSKRYTDQENIEAFALKAYGLLDLYAGVNLPFGVSSLEVLLRIANALDTPYQSVRAYAQPGRTLTLSLIYNLHKTLNHAP